MQTLVPKIQNKDKNDFKVKFTGARKRNSRNGKEMILGQRQRTLREGNYLDEHPKTIEAQESLEEDSNASKRQLIGKSKIPPSPKIIQYNQINSSAITSEFQILNSFFDYDVSFKLIYRASNHGFSVKEFHQICDGVDDTLTICLTQDNKVIGGFTPLSWEDHFHRNSTHFKTDFKRETFVFSVTDNAKYPLVKSLKNKAICCFSGYGPTFGGGYDLLIGDRSNQLPNTTSYFPRNFQHPNMNKFNKRDFTGTSRKSFKVQQWQVFQVIKLHSLKTIQNFNFENNNDKDQASNKKGLFERFKTAAKDFFSSLLSD